MPVWRVAPVVEEPEVLLLLWRILETVDGSRHFVGIDQRDNTGRVSSAVSMFDPGALRGSTRSGRVYQLVGRNGWAGDAQYVWEHWCELNSVASYIDVTERLLAGAQR
jgi:hypothetical protein